MLDFLSRPAEGATLPPVAVGPEPPDLLTQILLGLRLDGVEYGRCVMYAPWAVAFPALPSARFHFVGSGGAWLRTRSADWQRLHPGDAVLLPHGSFHVLASAPDVTPVDIDLLARRPVSENIYLLDGRDPVHSGHFAGQAGGAQAPGQSPDVVFCGALRFNLDPLHPLRAMMPEVMLAGDLARRDTTVPVLLDAMEREVARAAAGAQAAAALSEVELAKEIKRVEKEMLESAKRLEFESAARLRDQLAILKNQLLGLG